MKKYLPILCLMVLMGLLCACGNQSKKFAAFEKEAAWGQGEKLVFYDADTNKYAAEYATEATRANIPEEVGGIVVYSSSGEPDTIVLTLTDPVGQQAVAETTVNKKDLNSGEAGNWAEQEWADYLIHREIKALIQNKKATGDKYAVAVQKKTGSQLTTRFVLSTEQIPTDLLADSPDEVGFIVEIHPADWDGPDKVYVSLYDANRYAENHNFNGFTFDRSELPAGKQFRRFLNSKSDYSRFHSFIGKEALMGNGAKLICQDSYWTELFSGDHIPSDLLASTPEEVGLIVDVLEGTLEKTEEYSSSLSLSTGTIPIGSRNVTGTIEYLRLKLINPADGSLFYEESLKADPPEKIQNQDTFFAELDPAEVDSFLRRQVEIFLYDRRVRGMVEEGRIGGNAVVVYDEERGQYIPRGNIALSNADEQIGAVLHITKEEGQLEREDYSVSGGLPNKSSVRVTLRLEVLSLELRDLATGKIVAAETLTAPVPYSVNIKGQFNIVDVPISDNTLEDWVDSNWK